MRNIFLSFVFCLISVVAFGQQSQLAGQYFRDGEYEKASTLYQQLYAKQSNNDYYFNRYIECLLLLEQYDNCEKVIKKELKKNPGKIQLYVTYGNLYERQYDDVKAEEMYEKAIKKMTKDRFGVTKLATAFTQMTKYDRAIEVYEKGGELLNDKGIFAYNLGTLYQRKDNKPKMIESYLNSITENPARMNSVKGLFQKYLREDDFDELQTQLYAKIQDDNEVTAYPELLQWVFVQKKDYSGALRQARALDRRLDENGGRVYKLAKVAANDKDYDAAIAAYDYIVSEKGMASSFYIDAKKEILRAKRNKIIEGFDYTNEDILSLEVEYNSFLGEFGRSKVTASIVKELADLHAFYLKDTDEAIKLLNELVAYPGINQNLQAESKISLGDFYLIKGEIWEATLLYSQVDKAFKEDLLGHEARFRNAKLAYYAGDYPWAQAQFDVLKASTSKLISNDAIDLSVFIMDNLGLDTTATSLTYYSEADLLLFQNKHDAAFEKLDSLTAQFPEHSLEDDVYYLKAQIYTKLRKYTDAAKMYALIIEKYPEEIRADNAIYELGGLYETHLNDKEKAKELYETLFIDYSGSTLAVEGRKKYRALRGDDI